MSAFALATTSFAFMVAFVITWMVMIRRVQIGQSRSLLYGLVGVSSVLAFMCLVGDPGGVAIAMAVLSLSTCGLFVILGTLAGQSKQPPVVAVGKQIIEFSALDENGELFDLASLRGRPLLLKFFRGHW